MKKKIHNLFFAIFGLFLLVFPSNSFAQANPDLHLNSEISVTQVTDQYSVHTTLQAVDVNSFSNLTLIAVVDMDLDPPFSFVQSLPIIQTNGTININFPLNFDPTDYAFQFFLVDSLSLSASGGIFLFNPGNNSTYQTFLPTDPAWYNPNNGNQGGDNGQIDCSDPANADDLACQNQTVPAGAEFNPNYTFTSHLINPLGEGNNFDIFGFLDALFKNIVKIVLPFLVLFMIYSGFLFVEARGDTTKLETARKNFTYVIIGALLILGAWTIAHVLKGTVDQLEAMNFMRNFINLV